ncbi:MAG: mycothiol system anti-sigma-R factor [Acidimicrobiales bacterium]
MGEGRCGDDCNESLHELYHFLDGELNDARRGAIQKHLDDCPPCYETFDFEAELREVIARKCQDKVPETLRRRIANLIDHEVRHSD